MASGGPGRTAGWASECDLAVHRAAIAATTSALPQTPDFPSARARGSRQRSPATRWHGPGLPAAARAAARPDASPAHDHSPVARLRTGRDVPCARPTGRGSRQSGAGARSRHAAPARRRSCAPAAAGRRCAGTTASPRRAGCSRWRPARRGPRRRVHSAAHASLLPAPVQAAWCPAADVRTRAARRARSVRRCAARHAVWALPPAPVLRRWSAGRPS